MQVYLENYVMHKVLAILPTFLRCTFLRVPNSEDPDHNSHDLLAFIGFDVSNEINLIKLRATPSHKFTQVPSFFITL